MSAPKKSIVPVWVTLATGLFCLIAIADLPYGFYTLLRWVVCVVGGLLAVESYRQGRMGWVWAFGIIALLFNPIAKFAFDKEVWRVFDAAAGICFLVRLKVTDAGGRRD
jgi:predicted lysophospholipase L1 biosynthesis ABC-type transport system permease subunit